MASGKSWPLFVSFWLDEPKTHSGISSMGFRRLRKAINVVWFIYYTCQAFIQCEIRSVWQIWFACSCYAIYLLRAYNQSIQNALYCRVRQNYAVLILAVAL